LANPEVGRCERRDNPCYTRALTQYSPARNRAHLRASIQRPLSRRRDCRLPALLSRFPLELAATPAAAASENAGEAAPAPRVRGALGRKDFVRAAAAVCGGGGLSEAHAAALVARCDPRGASAPAHLRARLRSFARAHVGTGRFGVGAMRGADEHHGGADQPSEARSQEVVRRPARTPRP
jgi:hypothetical protein